MDEFSERVIMHFNRPLWDSLSLSGEDPFSGMFGKPDDHSWLNRVCRICGAEVRDRGLHYRFHAQLNALFAALGTPGEREVTSVITSEDEDSGTLIETYADGVLVATWKAEEH